MGCGRNSSKCVVAWSLRPALHGANIVPEPSFFRSGATVLGLSRCHLSWLGPFTASHSDAPREYAFVRRQRRADSLGFLSHVLGGVLPQSSRFFGRWGAILCSNQVEQSLSDLRWTCQHCL